MLCDEVGLGKTIEAGLALRALRMSGYVGRALLAVPASIAAQWQREMADKCLLPFARALGGAHSRHRVLLPREHERAAASLFAPELVIVSTGLLTRRERQPELKGADGWDLVCSTRHTARADRIRPPRLRASRAGPGHRIARDVLRPSCRAVARHGDADAPRFDRGDRRSRDGSVPRAEPRVALAYYGLPARLRAVPGLSHWNALRQRAARHVLRFDSRAARLSSGR